MGLWSGLLICFHIPLLTKIGKNPDSMHKQSGYEIRKKTQRRYKLDAGTERHYGGQNMMIKKMW